MAAVVYGVNGPVLTVLGENFTMGEMVRVNGLLGEVIRLEARQATVQLYESAAGIKPGALVEKTERPLSLTLRPGLIGGIFDGIMRPLSQGKADKWHVTVTARQGELLGEGAIFAEVKETEIVTYRAMLPSGVFGEVTYAAADGEYCHDEEIIKIGGRGVSLSQTWSIRVPRAVKRKLPAAIPLITGQRVIDSLFPIAMGGTCAIPGGFGTGKTMTQHQIAKHCNADIIIYIGCGERGNEMTEVLESFAGLKDPKSGFPLLMRTVLIANTSDMPVAAREASIYTGITLAECYRDMGYHVAVMADSTSRWAEALRELSARLEELPAEEGYPAYLAARIASFYERAGYVENLNGTHGSVTIIGAVSPQGADFSEPVTLHTKRFTRCFWALDRRLAYARHFPSINPSLSYSGYLPELDKWYKENIDPLFPEYREKILQILYKEEILLETVKLVGADALSAEETALLAAARRIRKTFTAQNAFDEVDTFCALERQFEIMRGVCGGGGIGLRDKRMD
ncbi:MAG: V-type ATP synthase subunit A [Defluviitaleaceae bacterium]|nr:V-type ATP synthase subunit A [Defluviitaleaceae bacterium]